MKTHDRDVMVARVAIIGMAVCSGGRGTTLAGGTQSAYDALDRLGESTDYRDAKDSDVADVCKGILAGVIRCNDAMWQSGDDGTILPRLARLALLSCH